MSSTIKNIIILVAVAVVLILAYVFFLKPAPEVAPLTSTSPTTNTTNATGGAVIPMSGTDFLAMLLNVKSIRLDDTIFSDPAFISLHDSSIELINDGTEGRPNPFAPIGSDVITTPINNVTPTTNTSTNITTPIKP